MSFSFGKVLRVQVFGQSHAAAIGVVLDGLPAGEPVDLAPILALMARRAPGKNPLSTARREPDAPEILCGLVDGHTCGAPLAAVIHNTDVRSGDYASLRGGVTDGAAPPTANKAVSSDGNRPRERDGLPDSSTPDGAPTPAHSAVPDATPGTALGVTPSITPHSPAPALRVPRPGHSDWPAFVRYGGAADIRGGGAFSGRMTAPLCFAGGVALQLLARRGIQVYAHIASVGGIVDAVPDACRPDVASLAACRQKAFPTLDDEAGAAMQAAIRAAAAAGDSVGGSIRCLVTGLPAGLGSHMFDGVENRLSAALFGIPGVRGLEFGSGFAGCEGRGSDQNDPYTWREGRVVTTKNDAGGVLGGATTGMPLVLRLALRPTPSIGRPQPSVDLATGADTTLQVKGRHDPCIVHRAVPVVEAVTALALLDLLLEERPPAGDQGTVTA